MGITDTNLTLHVADIDRSITFYGALGFTVLNRWGNHYAQLGVPGMTIGLHPEKQESKGSGNTSVGFTTDDWEGTIALLQQLSIPVTEQVEEGGKFLHFHDPDGTALYFIQPRW